MPPNKKRKLSNTSGRNEYTKNGSSSKNVAGTSSSSKKRPRDSDDDSQEKSQPPQKKKSRSAQQYEKAPVVPTQGGITLKASVGPTADRLERAYRDQVNLVQRVNNLGMQIQTTIEMIKPLVDSVRGLEVVLSLLNLREGAQKPKPES